MAHLIGRYRFRAAGLLTIHRTQPQIMHVRYICAFSRPRHPCRFNRRCFGVRGQIIDSAEFPEDLEPDTFKKRLYNFSHRVVVSALVLTCIGGILMTGFLSYHLHYQGHKAEITMSRCKYIKDVLRQHRVLVPFNEMNMDAKPLLEYYRPFEDDEKCIHFKDLEEEPIYGTLLHRYYETPFIFDWLGMGKQFLHDYVITLALIVYFARQPMREESTKRVRMIGDDMYEMLQSLNAGTPNEGKVTFENVCSFAAAAFATGCSSRPNFGKSSWTNYRQTYVRHLLKNDDIQPDDPVSRKDFSKVHGNFQYHLGLVPKNQGKNRQGRQI